MKGFSVLSMISRVTCPAGASCYFAYEQGLYLRDIFQGSEFWITYIVVLALYQVIAILKGLDVIEFRSSAMDKTFKWIERIFPIINLAVILFYFFVFSSIFVEQTFSVKIFYASIIIAITFGLEFLIRVLLSINIKRKGKDQLSTPDTPEQKKYSAGKKIESESSNKKKVMAK